MANIGRQRRRKTGRVYVVKHEHGYSKIGTAADPIKRLSTLQIACPYNLNLFTAIEVIGDVEEVEMALHGVYEEQNIRGEWFALSDQDLFELAMIDSIHASIVDRMDDWTPEAHLELTEEDRESLLADKYHEQVQEAVRRIREGVFPRENLTPDNAAVQNWAEKGEIDPEVFVESVRKHDLPNV